MKKINSVLKMLPAVMLLTATLLLGFANKASAQVSFSITATAGGGQNTGTFTSTGLPLSSGAFYETYSFNGKKVHSDVTFTFADGTISAKTHADVVFDPNSTTSGTGIGTWKIVKGTGAYAHLKGEGVLSFSFSGLDSPAATITQEWTGALN